MKLRFTFHRAEVASDGTKWLVWEAQTHSYLPPGRYAKAQSNGPLPNRRSRLGLGTTTVITPGSQIAFSADWFWTGGLK